MLRVGLIGAGYWGPNLIATLCDIENVNVHAVADLRPGRREYIHKRFPGVVATESHEDVLRDPAIDVIFIATPPDTHLPLAIQALQAGKHVFVEKPMATRLTHAEEMVEMAERHDRRLAVGHLFLFHPAVAAIRSMLDRGELGDVLFLSSTRANVGPPNPVCDVIWDLAPHDISIVLHLVGESPTRISAHGASFTTGGLTETAYINLDFPSGRMAQINVSWLTPYKTRRLEMVCSRKVVIYDETNPSHKLQIFDTANDNRKNATDKDASALSYGPGSIWSPALPNTQPLRAECEHFLSCIEAGRQPLNGGRNALDVVRILEAASNSVRADNRDRLLRATVAGGAQ